MFYIGTVFAPGANAENLNATVSILTDRYPHEICWEISDPEGTLFASFGPYDSNAKQQLFEHQVALPELGHNECYTFSIFDSASDG